MKTLLNILMVALAMIILSCLASTMAFFTGGGQAGTDLQALMMLQLLSVPVSLVVILAAVLISRFKFNLVPGLKRLYAAVPQWMLLAFLLLLLLVGSGEIALLIVSRVASTSLEWTAHAPLMSLFSCSLAICVLYAYAGLWSGRPDPTSGRW